MPEELIAIVAIVFTFGIPIAAILTHHQRKMAEIIHKGRAPMEASEVHALRVEVAELRDRLNEQTLLLDRTATAVERLAAMSLTPPQTPELQARIGDGSNG